MKGVLLFGWMLGGWENDSMVECYFTQKEVGALDCMLAWKKDARMNEGVMLV